MRCPLSRAAALACASAGFGDTAVCESASAAVVAKIAGIRNRGNFMGVLVAGKGIDMHSRVGRGQVGCDGVVATCVPRALERENARFRSLSIRQPATECASALRCCGSPQDVVGKRRQQSLHAAFSTVAMRRPDGLVMQQPCDRLAGTEAIPGKLCGHARHSARLPIVFHGRCARVRRSRARPLSCRISSSRCSIASSRRRSSR